MEVEGKNKGESFFLFFSFKEGQLQVPYPRDPRRESKSMAESQQKTYQYEDLLSSFMRSFKKN